MSTLCLTRRPEILSPAALLTVDHIQRRHSARTGFTNQGVDPSTTTCAFPSSQNGRLDLCPVTSKDVESSTRRFKVLEAPGSSFWSVCGGVVQLVRTRHRHTRGQGSSSVAL